MSLGDNPPIALRPLGIVLEAGSWLLVVLADGVADLVGIDDLRGLRLTGRAFTRPPEFDLAATWKSAGAAVSR